MIAFLLLAALPPPIDFEAQPDRPLPYEKHLQFEAAFADPRMPRLADVLEAEKVLVQFRCLGPMGRWRRIYSFGRNPKTFRLDTSLISFHFLPAGHRSKPAGRQITTLGGALDGPDDGHFIWAHGVYSIRSHRATLSFCGQNWPSDG